MNSYIDPISVLVRDLTTQSTQQKDKWYAAKQILTKVCQSYKAHGGIFLIFNQSMTQLEEICSIGLGDELKGVSLKLENLHEKDAEHLGSDLYFEDYLPLEELLLEKHRDRISSTLWIGLTGLSGESIGAMVMTYLYRIDADQLEEIDDQKELSYLAGLVIDNVRLNRLHQKDMEESRLAEKIMWQNEEQVKQTQKMEALGTLAGGIAHDFNNILTGIVGYTELSIEDAPRDSMMYQCLMESLKLAERAKELVSQILSFSRKTVNLYQRLDIEKVLVETIRMLRATFPSTIIIKEIYRSPSVYLYADPTEIQQLIMNLCINAEHSMREKGGILIVALETVENEAGGKVYFEQIKPGRYVKISIKDSGSGMNRQTMERIFEPFFTTKGAYEGTGLGLAVVHGIVNRHKGVITVDSELGKGSVFEVFLPA